MQLIMSLLMLFIIVFAPSGEAEDVNSLAGKELISQEQLKRYIHANYPGCDLYVLEDMEKDAKRYYLRLYPDGEPGFVCLSMQKGRVNCAVLMKKTNSVLGGAKLMFFEDIFGQKTKIFCLEDYGSSDISDAFIRFQKKANIPNHDPNRIMDEIIEMKSDGFEIVFFEQASRVYYWDNGKLTYIVTSD